jgi:predicted protein tyrosine phosphatase
MKKKLLFVCTANIQRSKTAENLFKKDNRFLVNSAGVSVHAKTVLSKELLNWADYVFVMEEWHKKLIQDKFPEINQNKIICLGIPDIYMFDDPELIKLLKQKIKRFFSD